MLDHDFLALVPIPAQLPVSTLVCPPTESFEQAYNLPTVGFRGSMGSPHMVNLSASQNHLPK
jgi:hypothetical protein